jgi:hypothetical protein
MDLFVCNFDNGDGQVANEERKEDGKDHLGYAPLVPLPLALLVRASGRATHGAARRVGRRLMLAHPLLRSATTHTRDILTLSCTWCLSGYATCLTPM